MLFPGLELLFPNRDIGVLPTSLKQLPCLPAPFSVFKLGVLLFTPCLQLRILSLGGWVPLLAWLSLLVFLVPWNPPPPLPRECGLIACTMYKLDGLFP